MCSPVLCSVVTAAHTRVRSGLDAILQAAVLHHRLRLAGARAGARAAALADAGGFLLVLLSELELSGDAAPVCFP